MALTNQQDKFLADMEYIASQIIVMKANIEAIHARGQLNNFLGVSGIQDVDLASSGSYAHLTQDKIFAADTAFQALLTALGDESTAGTNAARLLAVQP